MLNAAYCRAKADEWSERAEAMPEGKYKLRTERIARNWAALAAKAEAEEASEPKYPWTPERSRRL